MFSVFVFSSAPLLEVALASKLACVGGTVPRAFSPLPPPYEYYLRGHLFEGPLQGIRDIVVS